MVRGNRAQRRLERQQRRERRQQEREQREREAAESLELTPFRDLHGNPLNLRNLYRGASCFIILSGPSITDLNLSMLYRRGVITLGINNSPAIFRPNIWTYSDRPSKFHDAIWRDPAVLKSVVISPRSHMRKWPINEKLGPEQFAPAKWPNGETMYPENMPGVIGHVRNTTFTPETWLSEPSINRGNSAKSAKANSHPHCINTMFTAVKTAYALGFRIVYLLGCDFRMTAAQPYAFQQKKEQGGVNGNNFSYEKMNVMFGLLLPYFEKAGFHVYNCNPDSSLTVFDHVPYGEAIEAATSHVPQDPLDTEGWYS